MCTCCSAVQSASKRQELGVLVGGHTLPQQIHNWHTVTRCDEQNAQTSRANPPPNAFDSARSDDDTAPQLSTKMETLWAASLLSRLLTHYVSNITQHVTPHLLSFTCRMRTLRWGAGEGGGGS